MDLEKFWLGNVNEKGDVDQEGYDEETLQIVNTKASGLKNKLVDGVVDERDTQPQIADDDDVPVEKEATAVDYSHEVEAVDDDTTAAELEERARNYRRAELAFQNSTRGGPNTGAAKRKIDDDYDDEDSDDEAKPSAQTNEPQSSAANNVPRSDDGASALSQASAQEIKPAISHDESSINHAAHQASAGASGAMLVEPAMPADAAAAPQQQQEQPPKTDSIRKHGLLLFSEMFLFPSIQPRIARTRWGLCC
jgi:hypothetical protein